MKKFIHHLPLLFFAALVFLLQGCLKDTLTTTYTSFEPVYKSKAGVFQDIKSGQPQPLTETGKLALYGNYIFVNEVNKGVHIIDNSDPAAPQNIAFISIPGNIDLALKNNILYADIYTDMVAIDVSDPHQVVLKKVSHQVFPERQYSGGFTGDSSRYIVDWIKHETTDKAEIDKFKQFVGNGIWLEDGLAMSGSYNVSASASSSGQSIGGSMARFTIVGNYLYTVGLSALSTFNISTAADPVLQNVQSLGWNIETIYPLNNKLFIGSQTGMFIFNIDNPAQPTMLSTFSHACFSDPVIANDQYAFVTLKAMTGISTCWGVAPQRNEMDIVDITDITAPVLVKIYDMEEPMGLSLSGNHLFLCDGKGGLKVYDASDVINLNLLHTFTDINPFDVITHNGIAIVVAKEGLIQYDYSDINNIRKLSAITITGK